MCGTVPRETGTFLAIPETLGERLRSAMRRANVRNQAVADAGGVHVKTVSKWLSDAQVPDAEALDAVAKLLSVNPSWLRYGQSANGAVTTAQHAPPAWPQRARVFLKEFELEATKAGASDEDLAFIHRALFSPEAYVLYHDGHSREMTDEELMVQMTGLAEGLRVWLRERIKRRNAR